LIDRERLLARHISALHGSPAPGYVNCIPDSCRIRCKRRGHPRTTLSLRQCGQDLYLTAAFNIPPPVAAVVTHVARGKGMAGVAQVKKATVQTCNLQTDKTGNIKSGAKAVNAQAAVALPVFDHASAVRAVVGLAWTGERDLGPEAEQVLMELAASLPQ
jgi:L-methionine (R)-S-oxide reductase